MNYYAVKGINEDSFGYDFIAYKWRGAIKEGATYKYVELMGEESVVAHEQARKNPIIIREDITSTGDIAIPPAGSYAILTPAVGSEKPESKKKRKKGDKVITGDK